jgi:hypothetical protein
MRVGEESEHGGFRRQTDTSNVRRFLRRITLEPSTLDRCFLTFPAKRRDPRFHRDSATGDADPSLEYGRGITSCPSVMSVLDFKNEQFLMHWSRAHACFSDTSSPLIAGRTYDTHFIGHSVALNIHRGANVRVPHESPLYGYGSPHCVQPGAVAMPHGVAL